MAKPRDHVTWWNKARERAWRAACQEVRTAELPPRAIMHASWCTAAPTAKSCRCRPITLTFGAVA